MKHMPRVVSEVNRRPAPARAGVLEPECREALDKLASAATERSTFLQTVMILTSLYAGTPLKAL